jgi:glycosyltransferase involved in cell wall biosynthesis
VSVQNESEHDTNGWQLKIGIDAKWFFDGPPSGRVVIRNLVKHLVELPPDDDLYIFLDRRTKDTEFPYLRPHVHLVYVWGGINMISNTFVVPLRAWNLWLDVFIFQNFSPLFSNFRRHAYIHDVLFETHPQFYTTVERLYFWPLKYLARHAHRLCTVSATERQRMTDLGFGDESRIDVVYHGVDEAFVPREQHDGDALRMAAETYGLPDKFVLYVGRLNERKNLSNLLKALPLIRNTAIPLVVVGGYDGKARSLDGLVEKLGISDRVIFTGPVYGDDLPRIYALATIHCFVPWAESFGLPALEGMASGVPVVTSDRTSLPEICADAALYANPDSPKEIAGQVDRLLYDNQLWQQQRERGLRRAREFTWRRAAEDLMQSAHRAANPGT